VGPSVLTSDVLALHIAEFPEPLPECLDKRLTHGRGGGLEEADAPDLPRRLRVGGERRHEESKGKRSNEPDSPE